MELKPLIDEMLSRGSLDLHLIAGDAPAVRLDGSICRMERAALDGAQIGAMVAPHLTPRERTTLEQGADVGRTLRIAGRTFALQLFHERGQLAASIRALPTTIPTLEDLYETGSVGALLNSLVTRPSGLVIVTGYTGSGKMTTLAAMVETINRTQAKRILTIGNPLEYEFVSKQSLITQRNIGEDSASYIEATQSAFRSDVDVVLFYEMHDLVTMSMALNLADTGRLVLFPIHCERADQAVYRLLEAYQEPRGGIRRLLARNLLAVVAQALLPRAERPGRVAVNEVLLPTPDVRRMITEGVQELDKAIESSRDAGMQSMDDGILELLRAGAITEATARAHLLDLSLWPGEPGA